VIFMSTDCAGLPKPRSSNAVHADTDAFGFSLRIHSTSFATASLVYFRARSLTSLSSFGLPPGLPDLPFCHAIVSALI
jgi:hypothetical protein